MIFRFDLNLNLNCAIDLLSSNQPRRPQKPNSKVLIRVQVLLQKHLHCSQGIPLI